MSLIHSLHEYKEFNLNKTNESLVWFGTEMGSRSRIKTPKLKENICIIKICLIKWNIPLTLIGPNTLFAWVQSVQFE